MSGESSTQRGGGQCGCSRRWFIGSTMGAVASATFLTEATALADDIPPAQQRKIKLGWVGCGSRGRFLSPLFEKHGGFQLYAAADYRPEAVAEFGKQHGIDEGRRFSGLSGYRKVIESGVEAIVLETPPCFFPEHAAAAAEAGLHVYMAKPVAVDVPGCLQIEAAGKQATEKRRVFLVDYQLPTDPMNIKVARRVWTEEKGKLVKATTIGVSGTRPDLPKEATIAKRLCNSVWDNDIMLGGGSVVSYDVHAVDAALWLIGQRPVKAIGWSRIARPNAYSDGPDVYSIVYQYADGLIHEHSGMALANSTPGELSCRAYSPTARAFVPYSGRPHFQRRGEDALKGETHNPFDNGPPRNIATFYESIVGGRFDNPTVRRAVDGCLTCILGREAALRGRELTMEDLLKENKRIEIDVTGLTV